MPRFENPTILITRPVEEAERFLETLRAEAGPFDEILSPAFGFEALPMAGAEFDAAIFTSRAAVSYAPDGDGRVAYCVGDATARIAGYAGYVPVSANGSAEDLLALILRKSPKDILQHIRGENSRGNITEKLVAGGIRCSDVVAYRKVPSLPKVDVTEAVQNAKEIILPLFSAETVSIIAKWGLRLEGSTVIAISDIVAESAAVLKPAKVIVSDRPDMRGMAAATARLIA